MGRLSTCMEKQKLLLGCLFTVFIIYCLSQLFSALIQPNALEKGGRSMYANCQGLCQSHDDMDIASESPGNNSGNNTCPRYFEHIYKDLSPWEGGGITEAMLQKGARSGASMRVSIVGGKLYLKNIYAQCPQSRPLFTLWGLSKLLEKFPGQVPDVEFLINCKDRPIVANSGLSSSDSPPPVLSYCRNDKSSDILVPDYSFWGWPEVKIDPWELQSQDISSHADELAWTERRPSAFWRGNSRMGKMRKPLLECNSATMGAEIHDQDWSSNAAFEDSSKLSQQCRNRYNIYVEGAAWSASLKYRMACGSTMLHILSDYYDFFSRALIPGVHYLPIPFEKESLCRSVWENVAWGNFHPQEAERMGNQARECVENELSMEHVYDYVFHLLSAYAKLQRFTRRVPRNLEPLCSRRIQCIASDRANTMLAKTPPTGRRGPCMMAL